MGFIEEGIKKDNLNLISSDVNKNKYRFPKEEKTMMVQYSRLKEHYNIEIKHLFGELEYLNIIKSINTIVDNQNKRVRFLFKLMVYSGTMGAFLTLILSFITRLHYSIPMEIIAFTIPSLFLLIFFTSVILQFYFSKMIINQVGSLSYEICLHYKERGIDIEFIKINNAQDQFEQLHGALFLIYPILLSNQFIQITQLKDIPKFNIVQINNNQTSTSEYSSLL